MERITISLEDDLAREFDAFMHAKGYTNRSEAIRDLLRAELDRQHLDARAAPACVGVLSYVYDHHERNLAARLTGRAHDHHDLVISSMHAHLDHESCVETQLLQGATAQVRRFADAVVAETGVRHGALNLIPVQSAKRPAHKHLHLRPLT
ncbi:MAG TPA: nickel-responsive transcriptional regulator NikR [Burkholderiales bacterium]|nr:nickel-responsive transcriptional regulator NikR [Burkholderiales bacterium]